MSQVRLGARFTDFGLEPSEEMDASSALVWHGMGWDDDQAQSDLTRKSTELFDDDGEGEGRKD